MIHPIGTVIEGTMDFGGAVTSPSGVLWVDGVSSATIVTVAIVDTDYVTFSVPTTGRAVGTRLEVRITGTVAATSVTLRSAVRVMVDPIHKNTSYRYTNNATGAGFDDVTVSDIP